MYDVMLKFKKLIVKTGDDNQLSYPANMYLFKVNNRNTREGVKYVQG